MPSDYGIEIECLVPGNMSFQREVANGLAAAISRAGIPCSFLGYTHRGTDAWKIVTDQSISRIDGYVGLEIVSPVLTEATLSQVETVCRVLRENNTRTNRSCGVHVHIGARHLGITGMKRLAFLYIENEDVVDNLMPPSRRANNNTYCQSLKSRANLNELNACTSLREIGWVLGGSPRTGYGYGEPTRYVKLNFMSFARHGTVEFRQHSGTIDSAKIIRWAQFCSKLVDVAQATAHEPNIAHAALNPPRGRARRTIFEMAMRDEGVTNTELQGMLGRRSQTSVPSVLKRLGFTVRVAGSRNGQKIYKLVVPTVSNEPATLSGLLSKLAVTEEERQFWQARYDLLQNGLQRESGANNLDAAE
jgi:hypothetical protein